MSVIGTVSAVKQLKPLRQRIPSKWLRNYDEVSSLDGVTITDFRYLDPNSLAVSHVNQQSRDRTIDQAHLKTLENVIEAQRGWGDIPPVGVREDPMTGLHGLISGHHRQEAAINQSIAEVPSFVLEFDIREDGLNTLEEYKQAENDHKQGLGHNENAALKYLSTTKSTSDYFKQALKIKDEGEKKEKIRELANELLRRRYSVYSSQKRGAVITRFLNGVSPALIKTWKSREVDDFFVNNNHLEKLASYNMQDNRIDITTQAHTIRTYPIGQIQKELAEAWAVYREDGISEKKLADKKKKLTIRVGVYDNRPGSYKALQANRQAALDQATKMNLDNDWTSLVYNEIYFIYQSLRVPYREKEQPIVYKWDVAKQAYTQMVHVNKRGK